MDWTPVLTASVTAVATLGGVWMTLAITGRRERRRQRDERADRARDDLRGAARDASELFVAERSKAAELAWASDDFDTAYAEHHLRGSRYRLGLAIAMIPDARAREQLGLLLRVLSDPRFAQVYDDSESRKWLVPVVLDAAVEISAAYARGEEPTAEVLGPYDEFRGIAENLDAEVARAMASARVRHPAYFRAPSAAAPPRDEPPPGE